MNPSLVRFPSVVAAIVWLGMSSGTPAQESDSQLADLITLLKGRDDALRSLSIPFTATQVARVGAPSGGAPPVLALWKGEWARKDALEMTRLRHLVPQGGTLKERSSSHATWDGNRREDFTESGKSRTMKISTSKIGSFMAWLPPYFGLEFRMGKWPEVLGQGYTQVIGTETVSGRSCLKILCDPAHTKEEGFVVPIHVWIDVRETFLAWKTLTYLEEKKAPPEIVRNRAAFVEFGGKRFYPFIEMSVGGASRVGPIWVPTRGMLRVVANPTLADILLEFDAEKARVNGTIDPAEFKVVPKPETIISDEIDGEDYYVHPQLGMRTEAERVFEKSLADVAKGDGLGPSAAPAAPQPLLRASCGPQSLYFWLRLHGMGTTLEDLLNWIPERDEGASLEEMAKAAERAGTKLVSIKAQDKDLARFPGNVIAYLEGHSFHAGRKDTTSGHYVVARSLGNKVRVVSVPDEVTVVPIQEFTNVWTGYALVSEPVAAASVEAAKRKKDRRQIYYAVGGAVLLGTGLFLWLTRGKPAAAPAVKAAAVLLLATAFQGCSKGDAAAASPIRVVGSTTFEFGKVDEGDVFDCDFKVVNDGTNLIDLSASGSCSCAGIKLGRRDLAPGQETSVTVKVNTTGKGGGMHESVQLYVDGKKSRALWIVGEVRPLARMVARPYSVDLGTATVGTETSKEFTVELSLLEGTRSMSIVVPPAGQDAPVTWTVDIREETPRRDTSLDANQLVRRWSGAIRLQARRPGVIQDCAVRFQAVSDKGTVVTEAPIAVQGRIEGPFGVEPESIFLGALTSDKDTSFTFRIVRRGDRSGEPKIVASNPEVRIDRVEPMADGFRVHGSFSPRSRGVLKRQVRVSWGGDAALDIPIVARIE